MKHILYQLSRPFSYLQITHNSSKNYNVVLPAIFTSISLFIAYNYIAPEEVFKNGGLIDGITSFLESLPGFFIAALAAVATFNKPGMDDLMYDPPKLRVLFYREKITVEMTRRRFLCVLFAYLTAVSILLVVAAKFGLAIDLPESKMAFAWLGFILYFFIFWQMLVSTFLGLYYMGERLLTPSPKETDTN